MKLYKYYGFVAGSYGLTNTKTLIEDKKIRVSAPSSLNDPFEYVFNLIRKGEGQSAHGDKEAFHIALSNWTKKGVISLAAEKDNLLMWSHYGNSHNGVCIELDTEKCEILKSAQPVDYRKRIPNFNREDGDEILYVKSLHWSYENEYRIILEKSDTSVDLNQESITGVYLGMSVELENAHTVFKSCGRAEVPCFRARRIKDNYNIEFKEMKSDKDLNDLARLAALKKMSDQ